MAANIIKGIREKDIEAFLRQAQAAGGDEPDLDDRPLVEMLVRATLARMEQVMPASAEADMSRRVVAHLLACYKDRGGHAILLKENAALRAHAAGLAESCARLGRAAATLSEKQSGAPPPRAHEDEGGLLGKCFSSGFGQKEDIEELAGLAEELRSRLEAAQVAVKAGEARAAGLE